MSHILAIETSGKFGSVAIASPKADSLDSMASIELPRTIGSAQSLAQCIHQLTRESRIPLSDVGCIALVNGPGSFTGLRVGIATAKSIAYAIGIPVIGVDTLDVIQLQAACNANLREKVPAGCCIHATLDAYRGQIFVKSKDSVGRYSESKVVDLVEFLEGCRSVDPEPTAHAMVGPGVERIRRFVDRELVEGDLKQWVAEVSWFGEQEFEPHARFVAKLGLQQWAKGLQIDPIALLPNYFRGSAAEEKAKAV
ncbi:MAG: tRNA (adenosine(37)-N6)-threonylcarbamoyltransferase complex dimerization subunit type 1 TsaB [Pirellula sp.]|jgi:tRNA threonylcarbamoyladenosine biosynthesis protein TsaB|nr:tRNA (adenosine(37)-N6)-threonylcarbamoyltransferase complex dimerization subunit type 1 TsaB [Pirellula sp.]